MKKIFTLLALMMSLTVWAQSESASSFTGDANCDGKVDVADITTLASFILGNTPEIFDEANADVNKDNVIDVADITAVANIIISGTTKKTYIIMSDLHLGDQRAKDMKYGNTINSTDTIVAFLDYLKTYDSWDELILNGDIFDEWSIPSNMLARADAQGNPISEVQFLEAIVKANQPIFDRLGQLKDAGHKIVYILGNHDMQVTSDDLESVLPGLFTFCGENGIGAYSPDPVLFIEHGHRYDMFNSPYKGKVGIDNIPEGSILPPGFFIARAGTDKRMELNNESSTQRKIDPINESVLDDIAYDIAWSIVEIVCPLSDVVTGTDGMTRTYTPDEYKGSESRLFKGIDLYEGEFGWDKRCEDNGAMFVPSIVESVAFCEIPFALDHLGKELVCMKEISPRIVVWAHSHSASFEVMEAADKGTVIYVNDGCWVDDSEARPESNRCFAEISIENRRAQAALKQFSLKDSKPEIKVCNSDEILF